MKIIINLKGGIGNQLFQFAYALALAKQLNGNIYRYQKEKVIHSGLFPLFESFSKSCISHKTFRLNQKGWTFEEHNTCIPKCNEIFVDGYFQSSKFFRRVLREVVDMYTSFLDPSRYKLPKFETPTVVIHIRRGDYLKFPNIHPVQNKEYYEKGLESFGLGKYATLVICSDDLPWCRSCEWVNNLPCKSIHFPEMDVLETLSFMTTCDYHIIANSSLSWWGAFLAGQRNNKTKVVAPSVWFGKSLKHDTRDMYEPEWRKI